MADLIRNILRTMWNVKRLCHQVKANQRQCGRLVERVEALEGVLKVLKVEEEGLLGELEHNCLSNLHRSLQAAEELIDQHQDFNWLQHCMKAMSLRSRFEQLNQQLNAAAHLLSVSLQVEGLIHLRCIFDPDRRREEDRTDQQVDQQHWHTVMRQLEDVRGTVHSLHSMGESIHSDVLHIKKAVQSLSAVNPVTTRPTQEAAAYKEQMLCDSKWVQEYNSLPGEEQLLSQCYTELQISLKQPPQQRHREQEIRCHRFPTLSTSEDQNQNTSVDQFFSPDDCGDVPRAVILQGHSGHGKSFTVQKILHEWASGHLYQDRFELVFHLRCKELNHVSGERRLVDLVRCSHTFTPLISQKLTDSPQKVLFLIDGFDELRFPMSENCSTAVKDPFTEAPVEALLSALLKGLILYECFLLVTTRSTASDRLSKLLKHPQRFTEILGFSEEGVQEYFRRVCIQKNVSANTLSRVRSNEKLFSVCSIPVICWIVSTVFTQHLTSDPQTKQSQNQRDTTSDPQHDTTSDPQRDTTSDPQTRQSKNQFTQHLQNQSDTTDYLETTTSVYVHFVSTLLEHHCQGLGQPVPTLLRSLGQLAERGMLEQQVLFEKESVLSTVSDPASVPFLCKFLRKTKVRRDEMFSFMHLSFQEFFTALYYTLDSAEGQEKVKELLTSTQGGAEVKPHLLPVIQFLFGLSNSEVMQDLTSLGWGFSRSLRKQLKDWILKVITHGEDSQKTPILLFTLHCLYELHEVELVRRVMGLWGHIALHSVPLTTTDCWVLLYCLQCCPNIIGLRLTQCHITAEKLRMLQPALSRCEELSLEVDAGVSDVTSALGEGKVLRELCVTRTLSDESVQQLVGALSRQKCVGKVWLFVRSITVSTAEGLLGLIRNSGMKSELRVKIRSRIAGVEEETLCSVLRLERDGNIIRLQVQHSAQSVASGLRLQLPCPSACPRKLIAVLQKFHLLRGSLKNTPQCAEHVDALFSSLASLPGLEKVNLGVSCLTESWAIRIFNRTHTCLSLQEVQLWQERQDDRAEGSLCSALCLTRVGDDTIRLTVKHEEENPNPDPGSPDASVASLLLDLTHTHTHAHTHTHTHAHTHTHTHLLDLSSRISTPMFTRTLHSFHTLRRMDHSSHRPMDALFSSLLPLPGLKEVDLEVRCLTEGWASRVLSFFKDTPRIQEVKLELCRDSRRAEESLCSVLLLTRVGQLFWLDMSHISEKKSDISGLRLQLLVSMAMSTEMLKEILHRFHSLAPLRDGTPAYDGCVDAVLCSLRSLSGLREAVVSVPCLTERWASRILTLIKCHCALACHGASHCPCVETVRVRSPAPTEAAGEGLCSCLWLQRIGGLFRVVIKHFSDPSAERAHSGLGLTLELSSEITEDDLTALLRRLRDITSSQHDITSSQHAECDQLFSCLRSLPGLRKVELTACCLTPSWTNGILILSRRQQGAACPGIQAVEFAAGVYDSRGRLDVGLLPEDGIQTLRDARSRLETNITLKGRRCCSPSVRCSTFAERNLRCNQEETVLITAVANRHICMCVCL